MIDDLERVRSFRADEPPVTDESRRAARAALAQAMASSSQPNRGPSSRSPRPPNRRRAWLLRGGVVAVAVLAALVIVGLAGSGSVTAPSTAAAAVLRQLANIAAAGPSTVPAAGQYLFVDSENDYPAISVGRHGNCVTYATDHRQVWIGADGSGLLRDTNGPTRFTSLADRATCVRMLPHGQPRAGQTSNLWFAARCFMLGPTDDMQALSTNPRVLLRQMRRIDGGTPGPAEDFVHVGDFLRETDASPALRAALYRAAALIPGVHLLGMARDHLGRRGLGVAYDSRGNHSELIFNPSTSALMGEQQAMASLPGSSWAVYLQSRIVDRLRHRPPVRLSPPCVSGAGYARQTRSGTVMTGRPIVPGRPPAGSPTARIGG